MTEYTPRTSQDLNPYFATQQSAMSQYSQSTGADYAYGSGQIHYTAAVNTSVPSYSPTYLPTHGFPAHYLPGTSPITMQYPQNSANLAQALSQQRGLAQPQYGSQQRYTQQHPINSPRFGPGQDACQISETEGQDSFNAATMLSEPVMPPLDGYPDINEFDDLMKRYVEGLSPKKQDKALIHARRAANIKAVLIDKKTTAVESAQFRFWVKKMFTLQPNDSKISDRKKKICHEGKPVAVREKLFKILTRAHKGCQHGGRDKTSAQVRRIYSWVPKELISRFVKICPTCKVRRGSGRASPGQISPSESVTSPSTCYTAPHTPLIQSPPESRRGSIMHQQGQINTSSPLQTSSSTAQLQIQPSWLVTTHQSQGQSAMHMGSMNGLVPTSATMLTSPLPSSMDYSSSLRPSAHEDRHSGYPTSYISDQGVLQHPHY